MKDKTPASERSMWATIVRACLSFLKNVLSSPQGRQESRGVVVETVSLEEDEELGKLFSSKNNKRPLPGEPFMVPDVEEGSAHTSALRY